MPYAIDNPDLALFQQRLLGTWSNKPLKKNLLAGGEKEPLSYNVMPLPQVCVQAGDPNYPGYILKNFSYYETIRFNDSHAVALPAGAPNRSGRYNQLARAVFYDQQVSFAEGPDKGKVVHVENGAWLSLITTEQPVGPYAGHGVEPGSFPPQPANEGVAKQIAVPHGNSILALGSCEMRNGSPVIPGAPEIPIVEPPYPTPPYLSVAPFTRKLDAMDDFQNPNPDAVQDPNKPIRDAVQILKPTHYMHWRVTTQPIDGGPHRGVVTNIPFEDEVAKVTDYFADYWLLSTDAQGRHFNHLAYAQTIIMKMVIRGQIYDCPHTTCNTVTRH